MKEKIAFIINPKSGRKKKLNLQNEILTHLDQLRYTPLFYYTQCAGHAKEIASDCIQNGIPNIIAVGGDGTMNEIAGIVQGSSSRLGIIPMGSGNGLARHLKIPISVKGAVDTINKGESKRIDVGLVNEKFFFCVCGMGFDARISKQFEGRKMRGFRNYVLSVLNEYRKYKSKKYTLLVDGQKLKRRAFVITFANANQYGNDALIAPEANIQDGYIDVCILKSFPWYHAGIVSLRLFMKNINRSKYYEVFKAKNIEFKKKKDLEFHLDGESTVLTSPISIKILAGQLTVIC